MYQPTIPRKISTAARTPEQRALLAVSLLFTRHLHTVVNTATAVFCNISPLLALHSALTQSNKLTLYKLLIPAILTYTAHVCSSNYLTLQAIQSKCLRVTCNRPRRAPTSHLHYTLNSEPIPVIIHRLTAILFAHCPSHPNPPVQQIKNYTLAT